MIDTTPQAGLHEYSQTTQCVELSCIDDEKVPVWVVGAYTQYWHGISDHWALQPNWVTYYIMW